MGVYYYLISDYCKITKIRSVWYWCKFAHTVPQNKIESQKLPHTCMAN